MLSDLAATLVVSTTLFALIIAGLSDHRRLARLDEDIAALRRYANATSAYASDHADLIWGLSWQPNETYLMADKSGNLQPVTMPDDETETVRLQAVHLIRVLGDRVGDNAMPTSTGWLAPVYYSHLPLLDYLGADPLARWTASAADQVRQNWKDDPIHNFDTGAWGTLQPKPTPDNVRWPYTSGFLAIPAAWDYYQSDVSDEQDPHRLTQGVRHHQWVIPSLGVKYFGRTLADVAYPASKVHVHDTHQRHFGPREHYFAALADDGTTGLARVPVLMFDASVGVRATSDCNPGWRPNVPDYPCTHFVYDPRSWESPATATEPKQYCAGVYRWTRAGLKGIDFGARPVDTGQKSPGECDF